MSQTVLITGGSSGIGMESLHYELRPFNIQVKIVEPGAVNTQFSQNSVPSETKIDDYGQYVAKVQKNLLSANANSFDPPLAVARKIMQAATDRGSRMRYPVGNAHMILLLRKLLPLPWFQRIIRISNERG